MPSNMITKNALQVISSNGFSSQFQVFENYINVQLEAMQQSVAQQIQTLTNTLNAVSSRRYIVTSWVSGSSWYRLYSDKWIEQGGTTALQSNVNATTINFHVAFANTNYHFSYSAIGSNTRAYSNGIQNKQSNYCTVVSGFCTNTGVGSTPGTGVSACWNAAGLSA